MKRHIIVLCMLLSATIMSAQPSWLKKSAKSVFTLKTFKADGTLLGSSNGFFTSDQGDAVSSYTPFKGASHAVVIDASGKEYAVEYMLGANETYDISKFHVSLRKSAALPVATATAHEGETLWLLPYHETKQAISGVIRKRETVNTRYSYYTLRIKKDEGMVGCPLLNEAGQVVGLLQPSSVPQDTLSYAVSALMADSLHMTGLSINDPALRAVHLRKALPDTRDEALLTLYLASSGRDTSAFATLVDDFIKKYPQAVDGYVYRASLAVDGGHFNDADRDLRLAVEKGDQKAEAHYNYSRIVYQTVLFLQDKAPATWSLEKALDEVREAQRSAAEPTYRHHEAAVLYAMKRYADAADIYGELSATNLRSAKLFYEASRCREMLRDTAAQIALLDSAVATFSKPYLKAAAPYLLERARVNHDVGNYRAAIADYNEYETLMKSQLKARFYYLRFQAELGGRQYQLALNDINQAISMEPEYDLYHAEKASLLLRVGYFEEAVEEGRTCIKLAPDHSDGYLFLGVALCQLGQKEEGIRNLRKAGELGDGQAEGLIEKYAK